MKTRAIKLNEIEEKWYLIDAKGKRLGRVATTVSSLLIGKNLVNKAAYHKIKNKVIVLNSSSVELHPKKLDAKMYYRHSGFPGGLAEIPFRTMHEKFPNRVIELAIKGMLPTTRQREVMLNNLYIYEGEEHKHVAQKPEKIEL